MANADAKQKVEIGMIGRYFTHVQFQNFMFDQTTPCQEMIEFIIRLKEQNHLKIAVVNNEARELNEHRMPETREFEVSGINIMHQHLKLASMGLKTN